MDVSTTVLHVAGKHEFQSWMENPEEPCDWTGVARFLDLDGGDTDVKPVERMEEIRTAVRTAMDWCREQETDYFISGPNIANPTRVSDLSALLDFLVALTYRFPELQERGH